MYIEVNNVTKQFVSRNHGRDEMKTAIDRVSLNIEKGEFVCILGFSGCGKSTLLNILAGFEKPTDGTVKIDGTEVAAPSTKNIMIFQNYGLLPWRTVEKNVELGLEKKGVSKQERIETARIYTELVGLKDYARRFPCQLSGGQQQRVAIARGLAVNPSILFMDEPFGALDPITRTKLQDDLLHIVKRQNKTVVFVTHDIDEAVYLADRIVIMSTDPGRIQKIINVDLPHPAVRNSSIFNDIRDRIYNELYSISQQPLEYYL
jgi:NitT/TauT family transport system ATP-binding protein